MEKTDLRYYDYNDHASIIITRNGERDRKRERKREKKRERERKRKRR